MSDSELWQQARRYVEWLDHRNGGSDPAHGLLKIVEEAGEAAQAYIGMTGRNPRKGISHTRDEVAAELCDVILSAAIALHDFTDDPEQMFLETVRQRSARVWLMENEGAVAE